MKTLLKIIAFIAVAALTVSGTTAFAQEATTQQKTRATKTKTSKVTRGTVVNLTTFKKINAQDAGALANKGSLALMVGSKVIYVLKSDGSSAGEDLARLADGTVGVAGKTVTKGGMTIILADVIDVIK